MKKLEEAYNFVRSISEEGKSLLFVGAVRIVNKNDGSRKRI